MDKDQCNEERISKIKKIIEREIQKEILSKQDEVADITEKIEKALRSLDILKYVVTVNYYENNPALSSRKGLDQEESSKEEKPQTQIHPCVKRLLPFRSNFKNSFKDANKTYETRKSAKKCVDNASSLTVTKENECLQNTSKLDELSSVENSDSKIIKNEVNSVSLQPQYIPPLPNPDIVKGVVNSQRGGSTRVQHRIIVGNISKWIPPDTREDNSTHKWMVYIRNQTKDQDVTQLIRKVRYFLHDSYKPHDIIDVTSSPFHLTRRGWGEFPIRVQLHFHHPLNKPVDIIHHLKLDMTCSGVQTLGAETVVELCLHQSSAFDGVQSSQKKIVLENKYANGKKTTEKSDVFDGNLLMSMNGIKRERVNDDQDCLENSFSWVTENQEPLVNNSNLILDRRKLQELISKEHDYIKNNCSAPEEADEKSSILKSIKSKNGENLSGSNYKNGTVLESIKYIPKMTQNLSSMEMSMSLGESEIFKNLKSVVSKLEGETQSKYCMKVLKHSYLVNILQRAHATKLRSVEALINWFFRRWPIITKLAMDPTYKHIHPYSCQSEEEFFQFNIGKQRSAEWFRAKAIQKILISLKPVFPIDEEIWTTKQILMWSRFHGYSPLSFARPTEEQGSEYQSKRLKSNDSSSDTDCDSSDCAAKRGKTNDGKFVNGLSVIERKRNFKRGRKKYLVDDTASLPKSYKNTNTYSDLRDVSRFGSLDYRLLLCGNLPDINVLTVDEEIKDDSTETASPSKRRVTITTTPADEVFMNRFICGATRQIGIKLSNEEIIPRVMCDSVARVMSQAVVNFLDDLLRRSFAQAWLRNGNRAPSSLELDDVLATLIEHPPFDIFTNRGLGAQPPIKSEH